MRFPEFEGEWDSSPMGALGTFTKGAPLSKADVTETGTPLILYGELYTTYGDIANTIVRKTDKDVKSECYSMLGDVIIPTSGESPEEISTCTCVMQDGVILAGDLNIYRTNDLDGRFLSYEINHVRNREIAKIAQGKSIVHIKADELAKIVIRFPSKAEQSKIIELFSCLDRKIELQKELIESLKLYKRGLLSKLFPQKGESVPQYRFTGFTDAWEQRKLGEVFKERTERAVGDEELLSVTIGSGVIRQADSDKRNIASEDKSNYKIVCKGDVPYNSMRMWQGAVGNSEYDGIVSPAYTVLVPTAQANGKFFMELFMKESTLKIFQRWSQGLTSDTWNLKYPVLSSIEFYMPSMEEQTKIAEYFKSLDRLITLHQRKCNEMQSIKKFMLQNMFV